jgi:zinc transport system substrate-binding protein
MSKFAFRTLAGLFFLWESLGSACCAAEGIRISVSILPQAYFVERVAGTRARVHVMIPKGASPETYEPTPQQLVALSDSQLYVKVGAPGFPFEGKYLQAALGQNRKIRVVNMSDGMTYREEDPHVWTSLIAVRLAAQNIGRALEAYDPTHADEYRNNLRAFLEDIDAMDREIKRTLAEKKGSVFMVYHPAWGYFADEYGLVQLAVEEEGKPVNAAHIRRMVDLARRKGIRAILVQKGFDTKSARTIARDIGGEVVETDPLERDWLAGMKNFTAILTKVLRK